MPVRQDIYFATVKEIVDNGRTQKIIYNEPIKYRAIVSPINGNTELQAYGERVFKMYKVLLPSNVAKTLNEGDLVYFGIVPDSTISNCADSNYKIASVRMASVKSLIYIEKKV